MSKDERGKRPGGRSLIKRAAKWVRPLICADRQMVEDGREEARTEAESGRAQEKSAEEILFQMKFGKR